MNTINNIQTSSSNTTTISNRNLLLFIITFTICYLPSCIYIILGGFLINRNVCDIIYKCEIETFQRLLPLVYFIDILAYFPLVRCIIDPILGICVDRRLRACCLQMISFILLKIKITI